MSVIQWTPDLSVNIQEIDLQHRRLIELIADLEQAMLKGEDKQVMNRVISELNAYVREHFSLEEKWMTRFGYPGLREHAAQHEAFIERLLHFELDHLGGRAEVSRELLDFLVGWFRGHVTVHDQLYAQFFLDKGVV